MADTGEYALHYVDDLVVFSKTFDELCVQEAITAGCNINLDECNFFAKQKSNLYHT